MLELLRAVSHWAHGFKHSTIFLFNTGEEEGLDGAHAFITQHPWSTSIRMAIDLEAIGVGGKSMLFQGGPDKAAVELFAKVAKHPAAQILAQDFFLSGFIKSATDFQVYKEVANLSGLDFAFMDNAAVYHTKNDKLELLTPGSLQHIGDNMLAIILDASVSEKLPVIGSKKSAAETTKMESVYFDVLGIFTVTYSQHFARQLYCSIIAQSALLLLMSLSQGGWTAFKALLLSILSILLSWIFALGISYLISVILPYVSFTPIPYIAHPWLAVILFGMPALFGALVGHHVGFKVLKSYLYKVRRMQTEKLHKSFKDTGLELKDLKQSRKDLDVRFAVWDAERWLFKAGILQWVIILAICTWFEVGAAYIAMIWAVSPALAYGLIDATYSPKRAPQELKIRTLLAALFLPLISTGGIVIVFVKFLIGNLVRFDRSPGYNPDWVGNLVIAMLIAAVICLFLVYIFPIAHRSGGLKWILCGNLLSFLLAISLIGFEVIPPFTENTCRVLNAVQVVEIGSIDGVQKPTSSFLSLSSFTPGKLTREIPYIKDEGFSCEKTNVIDMVTYDIKYGCVSATGHESGDNILTVYPKLELVEEKVLNGETLAKFHLDAEGSLRWVLALNTTSLKSFQLDEVREPPGERHMLALRQNPASVEGWHIIQFVSGRGGPTKFDLSLTSLHSAPFKTISETFHNGLLLKWRTDVNMTTAKLERTIKRLPKWVSFFGKSTSPYPLTYLIKYP
ncbi:hypothetical protein KP509_35G019900 [Ceratopteris richardii]|nr:hypothetical protein KP509_35G019900 [Ceratopteris richardii]